MCAGFFSPSDGSIHVASFDMADGPASRSARKYIGYCPQDNALLEMMTTREHLFFYSNLKGVPSNQIPQVVESKLRQMSLKPFESNYAANLSGGNKRKLMVACALIGDPPIILADEPSAGMDPVARRFMWSVIQNVAARRKRSSVLLSTHSMEECEALCTRSVMMVNGVFRCLGTNHEICERYGGGYDLMVKVQRPSNEEMSALVQAWGQPEEARLNKVWASGLAQDHPFLEAALMGTAVSPFADPLSTVTPRVLAEWCIVTGRFHKVHAFIPTIAENVELVFWHYPIARYKVVTKRSLGDLFDLMEKNKSSLNVLEYSISATTLDQIFHSFAQHQEGNEDEVGAGVVRDNINTYLQVATNSPLPQEASAAQNAPALQNAGTSGGNTPVAFALAEDSAPPQESGVPSVPGVVSLGEPIPGSDSGKSTQSTL